MHFIFHFNLQILNIIEIYNVLREKEAEVYVRDYKIL